MANQDPCGLMMLPTDVLENILSRLSEQGFTGGGTQFDALERALSSHFGSKQPARETASLASCSSLATVRVMQCLRCTWALKPSETADGVIAKLASTARGMGLGPSDLRGGVCVDGLATNVLDYDAIIDEQERRLRAFPPVLRRPLECGMLGTIRKLDLSDVGFRRLPEGMSALTELNVAECGNLDECWLPESSGRRIRKLIAVGSNVVRLPESMESLEKLDVSYCEHLAADDHEWLPRSSRGRVRNLIMESSNLTSVPGGMEALETLLVSRARLEEDWLPRDSRRWVKTLAASRSEGVCVPEDMPELESLELEHCTGLGSDTWLPPSSSGRLRKILVNHTDLRRLPENLDALEYVDVESCRDLAEDWLPESSATHVTFVLAGRSNLRKLPPNMAELAFVDVSCTVTLEADFLPASSGRVLAFVNASDSNIRRLPAHMEQLVFLNVTSCHRFDDVYGVPASSRGKLWPLKPGGQAPADDTTDLGRANELNLTRFVLLLAESWNGVQRSPHYVDDFFGDPHRPSQGPKLSKSPISKLLEEGLYRAWYRLQEMFGSATLQ